MRRLKSFLIVLVFATISLCSIMSPKLYASWQYSQGLSTNIEKDSVIGVAEFVYTAEDMPVGEVHLLQRLSDVLNNKYTTETISNSREYLINKTIQMYWGGNIYFCYLSYVQLQCKY